MFGKEKTKIDISKATHYPLDVSVGLTNEQVNERIEQGYINKTKKYVTKSYFRIFYDNLVNFFNLLLFAIAILMIIARLPIINFAFLVILIANITIGLYQDIRARKLIDKLKVVSSPKVKVLRDGKLSVIPANQVVLDDLIEIKTGSQIVCDGSIVSGFVEANESLLTGESVNISKNIGDAIYSGSFITAGTSLYRVEQLGSDNYAERLQNKASKFKRTKSEILLNIKRIFRVITFFVIVLGATQFIMCSSKLKYPGFANVIGSDFYDTIDKISGSLVAMIPTGMYLLTSVTLAVGVIRLVKKNMLTQDMYCIEMLARVDTLCLDKTGTLTDGNLNVACVVTVSDVSERDIAKMVYTLVDATKDENATARAIKEKFCSLNKFDSFSAIPFSSDRKYSAVMLEDGRSVVMGAREFIPHNNPDLDEKCRKYEKLGMRVLVVGVHTHVITIDEPLNECEIIGFIALEDHIREDAPDSIQWFKDNGVSIRIITGDNPESASEIARRAGIEGYDKYISLEGISLEDTKRLARDYVVFGRVSPEQKEVLVESMQADGHSVAMTGDGVNDILALRVADCSIAMASGSDAAKNVSHLVSMDSNFSALPDVVKEGRRVINNLQRAVSIFLVKTVFAIVITSVFIIWALFDKELSDPYPFSTNQLLIWEMINIGIGSLFLSLQPNDEKIKSKFLLNIVTKVAPAALIQILIVLFYFIFYRVDESIGSTFMTQELATTFSVLTFSIFSFIILIRVCWPFDIYRIFLVVGLGFIEGISMFADFLALGDRSIFGITYSSLTRDKVWLLFVVLGVSILLYVLFEFLTIKLHNYIDKKKEAEKYDYF